MDQPTSTELRRRPIRARQTQWAHPIAGALTRAGVQPNHISQALNAGWTPRRLFAVPSVSSAPFSQAALVVLPQALLTSSSVRWVGCEPSTRQGLYFANHTSHLDALVL